MRATDPAHRHDRLALRLSVIISRLLAGESLSLKALSGEFGVSERTLRRDSSKRLLHLDRKCAARTVLTGMCYSVGSATRQGSSSLTRFIGQSAMTSRT